MFARRKSKKDKSVEEAKPTQEEPINTPVDITPLLIATKKHDWETFDTLIRNGCSLLWVDNETSKTVIRLLAEEGNGIAVIHILKHELNNAKADENTIMQEFLLAEAIHGAVLGEQTDILNQINSEILNQEHKHFLTKNIWLAEVETGKYGFDELKDISPYNVAEALFHLVRGKSHGVSIQLLKHHVENLMRQGEPNEEAEQLIISMIWSIAEGAGLNPAIDFNNFIRECELALISKNDVNALIHFEDINRKYIWELNRAEIAISAANGNIDHALKQLSTYKFNKGNNLDLAVSQAIISAAKRGRWSVIQKLYAYAKHESLDTPLFMSRLAEAAGSALVHEHFSLTKLIVQIAPTFSCTNQDNARFSQWSDKQIARSFRLIDDPHIFYEIACALPDPRWLTLLKSEYGLTEMSNEGFHNLVKHPEFVQFLFQYKMPANTLPPDIIKLLVKSVPDCNLSNRDMDIFMSIVTTAKEDAQKSERKNTSLFRLHCLLISPSSHHCCNTIKEQIIALLDEYLSGIHLHKSEVRQLRHEVNSAKNIKGIYDCVQQHVLHANSEYSNGGHVRLLEQCMRIFDKFGENPEVKYAKEQYAVRTRNEKVM